MIDPFSKIQLKKEKKIRKIVLIKNRNDFTFFGIVDQKIGVGEPSIAYEKHQSSFFMQGCDINSPKAR